jgi:hypothetical protein
VKPLHSAKPCLRNTALDCGQDLTSNFPYTMEIKRQYRLTYVLSDAQPSREVRVALRVPSTAGTFNTIQGPLAIAHITHRLCFQGREDGLSGLKYHTDCNQFKADKLEAIQSCPVRFSVRDL